MKIFIGYYSKLFPVILPIKQDIGRRVKATKSFIHKAEKKSILLFTLTLYFTLSTFLLQTRKAFGILADAAPSQLKIL